jgi:hypothetical protein
VAEEKPEIRKENKTLTMEEMQTLVKEEIDMLTQNVWQHARTLQDNYSKQIMCDQIFVLIIFYMQGSNTEYT